MNYLRKSHSLPEDMLQLWHQDPLLWPLVNQYDQNDWTYLELLEVMVKALIEKNHAITELCTKYAMNSWQSVIPKEKTL